MPNFTIVWATTLSIGLLGCGPGEEATYPVEGVVRFQDEPVGYGLVTLIPAEGPPLTPAPLSPEGRFSVNAAAGPYKVLVSAIPPPEGATEDPLAEGGLDFANAKPAKSLVPLKYSRQETSDVTVVVEPVEKNQLAVNLKE